MASRWNGLGGKGRPVRLGQQRVLLPVTHCNHTRITTIRRHHNNVNNNMSNNQYSCPHNSRQRLSIAGFTVRHHEIDRHRRINTRIHATTFTTIASSPRISSPLPGNSSPAFTSLPTRRLSSTTFSPPPQTCCVCGYVVCGNVWEWVNKRGVRRGVCNGVRNARYIAELGITNDK